MQVVSLSLLDRARYRIRQGALLHLLGSYTGVWHRILGPDLPRPGPEAGNALRERLETLLTRDLEHVERGVYPRALLFQFPTFAYLKRFPALLREAPRVLRRVTRGDYEDLPQDVDLSFFPRYYRRTFHWQTDGWLSERSADLYDLEVEVLFAGTADVMRRMALAPMVETLVGRRAARVLDLGCGTGRFLSQLRGALPKARLWGLDLSPYYLARAHELLCDGGNPVSLVADNAEQLPFRDDHFDAVSAVFLLHELPRDARRRVLDEARRVLAPGGRMVVCDSAQPSDSPALAPYLNAFPRLYHEPYFRSYLRDDLQELLTERGFEVEPVEEAFLSKICIARKPRAV